MKINNSNSNNMQQIQKNKVKESLEKIDRINLDIKS